MLHIWDPRDGDFVSFRERDEMFDGKRMVGKVGLGHTPVGEQVSPAVADPGGGRKRYSKV